MNLTVRQAAAYDGRRPPYHLPLEIGCFSENSENKFVDDNHQMKFIIIPYSLTDLEWDLNEGYENFIKYKHGNDFENILKWILGHEEQVKKSFTDSSSNPKPDFVLFRGVLTQISSTVYEKQEDWLILASKFRSVIYLNAIKTEDKIQKEANLGKKGDRFTTYGFKFEQFMTSTAADSRPNTSIPVDENEKYFTVLKGKLANHRLLFSAEVDGVDPEYLNDPTQDPNSTFRYVELKTSRFIDFEGQRRNFLKYKLLKWYLQSYFSGIPRVICGFRDDAGIARELGIYNVRDMPRMAEGHWSPSSCLNFCTEFLNFVKRCVVKDDPKVVYRFYWRPNSSQRYNSIITCEELPTDEERFLPEWYTESVKVI